MHCWVGGRETWTARRKRALLQLGRRGGGQWMHCWVDGRETWTARWEWAVCAAGWVGQEVGNGCTAGWVGERSGLLGASRLYVLLAG
jgi:hypothetical protein